MSKIGKIFENTVKKIEEKSQSQSVFTINLLSIYQILEKVTNLWKKDKKHDE